MGKVVSIHTSSYPAAHTLSTDHAEETHCHDEGVRDDTRDDCRFKHAGSDEAKHQLRTASRRWDHLQQRRQCVTRRLDQTGVALDTYLGFWLDMEEYLLSLHPLPLCLGQQHVLAHLLFHLVEVVDDDTDEQVHNEQGTHDHERYEKYDPALTCVSDGLHVWAWFAKCTR